MKEDANGGRWGRKYKDNALNPFLYFYVRQCLLLETRKHWIFVFVWAPGIRIREVLYEHMSLLNRYVENSCKLIEIIILINFNIYHLS